jgi:hypothetical protein
MSISGIKSYRNSNTSGSNSFQNLTSKIDENAQNILINTANISDIKIFHSITVKYLVILKSFADFFNG